MQIPADKRVRQYELTYLVPASLTSDEASQVSDAVAKLIKKHKGTVESTDEWGKRELAYTIQDSGKRYDEATYTHMVIEFETLKAQAFEKDLYLNNSIIRHLFVVAEEVKGNQGEVAADAE